MWLYECLDTLEQTSDNILWYKLFSVWVYVGNTLLQEGANFFFNAEDSG